MESEEEKFFGKFGPKSPLLSKNSEKALSNSLSLNFLHKEGPSFKNFNQSKEKILKKNKDYGIDFLSSKVTLSAPEQKK